MCWNPPSFLAFSCIVELDAKPQHYHPCWLLMFKNRGQEVPGHLQQLVLMCHPNWLHIQSRSSTSRWICPSTSGTVRGRQACESLCFYCRCEAFSGGGISGHLCQIHHLHKLTAELQFSGTVLSLLIWCSASWRKHRFPVKIGIIYSAELTFLPDESQILLSKTVSSRMLSSYAIHGVFGVKYILGKEKNTLPHVLSVPGRSQPGMYSQQKMGLCCWPDCLQNSGCAWRHCWISDILVCCSSGRPAATAKDQIRVP